MGFDFLKINVVVIFGVNDYEVLDLAVLIIGCNWYIWFIEFMFIGNDKLFDNRGWIFFEELR